MPKRCVARIALSLTVFILLSSGVFSSPAAAQFETKDARYVRFVAESEVNGKPWTSVAEFHVLDGSGNALDRGAWSVSADSEEVVGEDGAVANAVDGNTSTIWHTEWAAHAGDANDPPHSHEMIIDLAAISQISGVRYLPRQNGQNGRVASYLCYTSVDGVEWGSPVAQGQFANDAFEKTVFFDLGDQQAPPPGTVRYVRFVAESEVNDKPWTAVAELYVLDGNRNRLDRRNWSVSADSQELAGEDGAARNAIDGDGTSIWHTEWASRAGDANDPPHAHELIIDLAGNYELSGVQYLPRQNSQNGRVREYSIYLSSDGSSWGSPVTQGIFPNTSTEQTVFFDSTQNPSDAVRYARFVAESEVNGKPWTSMAEFNLLDTTGGAIDRSSWSVSAESEELNGEDGAAENVLDGNSLTVWHTEWAAIAGDANDPAHPHALIIDLGQEYELSGFRYLPRPDYVNGRVDAYSFYLSPDGVHWGRPVAQGRFVNDTTEKTVFFGQIDEPTNQAPVVSTPGTQDSQEGEVVSFLVSASDPDGDPLSYQAEGLPSGVSIDANTGRISGTLTVGSANFYAVTVTVSDGQASASTTFGWLVNAAETPDRVTGVHTIAAANDDAEESSDGTVVLSYPELELAEIVGLRFGPLNVPARATIINAYLQFTAQETHSQTTTLEIRGQTIDHATPFSTDTNELSSRINSDAFVQWQPEPWQTVGERGEAQQSPDLSVLLQEIVNQPTWATNNAVALFLSGSGRRVAVAADSDSANAPQLHLKYTTESGVHFAVIGDFGSNRVFEADVATLVHSHHVDFVATVGDNNYPDGEASTIDRNVGKYYQQYIRPYTGSYGPGAPDRNRFWPALGNHDWVPCRNVPQPCTLPHEDYFVLPNNERYYDVVEGPVHLFIIDSDRSEPDGNTANSVQAAWLQQRLAASTATHKLVLTHHAPYSSGTGHGSQSFIQWPFKAWGATGVLAGHDHIYERLLVDDLVYIVNGASGAVLYNLNAPLPQTQVRYNEDNGALFVTATASLIKYQFVNRDGEIIDTYVEELS